MWPEKWCIYPYMETSLNEYRKINQNSRSALYIENRTTQVFFFFSPYRNCCLYFNYKTKSALTQESVWILLIANQYIFNQYFYISDESKNMIWNQAYSVLFFFSDFWDGFTRSRLKFNPMQRISEASAVTWNYREGTQKKKSFTRKRKNRL